MPKPTLPELIFGIVGPIGVNVDSLCSALEQALRGVNYRVRNIKITELMSVIAPPDGHSECKTQYETKIKTGNFLRRSHGNSVLAELAAAAIKAARDKINSEPTKQFQGPQSSPDGQQAAAVAYIIRQLKHPAEIDFLKRIYGQKFVQISATHHQAGLMDGLTKKYCATTQG